MSKIKILIILVLCMFFNIFYAYLNGMSLSILASYIIALSLLFFRTILFLNILHKEKENYLNGLNKILRRIGYFASATIGYTSAIYLISDNNISYASLIIFIIISFCLIIINENLNCYLKNILKKD